MTAPRITRRTREALLVFEDRARRRVVVYRSACKVSRKTSVRYSMRRTRAAAWVKAREIAARLAKHAPQKLREFRFCGR